MWQFFFSAVHSGLTHTHTIKRGLFWLPSTGLTLACDGTMARLRMPLPLSMVIRTNRLSPLSFSPFCSLIQCTTKQNRVVGEKEEKERKEIDKGWQTGEQVREHCITRHGGVGRLWALLLAKTNTSDERNKIMYYCVWRKYSENLACKRRFHGDILTTKAHTHTKRGTKQDKLRTNPRRLPFPPSLSSSIILLSLFLSSTHFTRLILLCTFSWYLHLFTSSSV